MPARPKPPTIPAPREATIRQSLHGGEVRLEVEAATCRKCGFVFAKRERPDRPGRCPVCRGESISEPRFSIRGEGEEQT